VLELEFNSLEGTTPSSPPFTSPSDGRSSIESSSPTLALENKDEVSWFCYPQRNSATPSHNNGLSQIPLIRVASKSLHLELMALTNWPVNVTMSSSEHQGSPESCASPPPDADNTLKSSLTDPVIAIPTFTIPTSHTHRKAKMDRIRKRLGSEVPYDVVFPEDVEQEPGKCLGRKWSDSEKLTPRRKDTMKPVPTIPPAYSSNPRRKHPERRRPPVTGVTTARLSFISEYPDESSDLTVDALRITDGTAKRRNTADSHLSTRSEDREDGQGVVTLRKRSSSYRKPPPSMLDDSICSF